MFSNCDVQIDDTGGSIYINVYTGIYTGISYQYIYDDTIYYCMYS